MRTARSSSHPGGGGFHQAPREEAPLWEEEPPRRKHPPREEASPERKHPPGGSTPLLTESPMPVKI